MIFRNDNVVAMQIILNIILVNGVVTLAILGIHEISHVLVGMQLGCESGKAILFDTSEKGPYAEVYCPAKMNPTKNALIHIGSFLLPSVFGFLFLFLRNWSEKSLFFIILGLSLLFCSLDIVAVSNIESLFFLSMTIGILIIIFGEISLTSAYIKREKLFM
jgi:hypothetical protein